MALLWSLATATCAFAKNFTHLFIARSAIGLGEAGYAPGGTAMISALFPEKKRAMLVGIWNISIPLGSALGVAFGRLYCRPLRLAPCLRIGCLTRSDYRLTFLFHSGL